MMGETASCALTLDMSGGWKRAKHAGRRPLDGRVRLHCWEGAWAP
jgi:hypothetical protein